MAANTNNKKPGPLSTFKRTFSASSFNSDPFPELIEEDWPPSPPRKPFQPSANVAPASSSSGSLRWSQKPAQKNPWARTDENAVPAKKKRSFPWDDDPGPPRKPKAATGAFRILGEDTGDGSISGVPVKSSFLNIKQKVVLSPEQQRILKLVVEDGKSVFFTGSAGDILFLTACPLSRF
jgi:hypothetical protein